MERRNLLQSLALGAIGVGCSRVGAAPDQAVSGQPPLRPPDARVPARRKNWVWIGLEPQKPPDSWKRDFARMRASGIDAIVPEIYNGRHAYFGSQRLPVKTARLEMMLPLAKAEGLEVHAWMWSMPCLIDDILQKHPDW